MLSNPTNNLHNRQRQHRRQNSTPTAFEPVKASNLPHIQRHGAHRRGMSLDQRRRQSPPQELMVQNTNTGYTTTSQHILREAQQQRLTRPGPCQQQHYLNNDENYLHSPVATPQRQSFDPGCFNEFRERAHNSRFVNSGPVDTAIGLDHNNFNGMNDFNLFSAETALTPSAFLDFSQGLGTASETFPNENTSRRLSQGRRISGGIVDRVAQFEQLALQSPQRPFTPPNQNGTSYFPPSPMDTPHDRIVKYEPDTRQFYQPTFDTSMEETIKPKSEVRTNGIFDDMRRQAEMNGMPSPPRSGQMQTVSTFDSAPMRPGNFMNVTTSHFDFVKSDEDFENSHYSPESQISPSHSYHPSPEVTPTALFGDPFTNKLDHELPNSTYPDPSLNGYPVSSSPVSSSAFRRSESVSSINVDESITDTGITIDDIATFISGPDPVDNKWLCLYPECKKRFGRKENIKSHVQTHLGDRQFQCPHCKKCFVRQHDLKRHAKIHSGVKPYPCQCGNSFARHDALTRHRQRGMCIGAFEGVVKKVVKRGRPRKPRPDDEERLEKSSRTRSRHKAMSSASSNSGYSDSNGGLSPGSELDVLDDQPFGDYDYTQSATVSNNSSHYSQPESPVAAGCVSPQMIQAHSPSGFSIHSQAKSHSMSRTSSASDHGSTSSPHRLPPLPSSPTKSSHSYHSPPGLCESSSSPMASNFFDVDSVAHAENHLGGLPLANISECDDELFLEAFSASNNEDISALERDPGLLMGKFEDAFNTHAVEDMFRNDDNVFFGSP